MPPRDWTHLLESVRNIISSFVVAGVSLVVHVVAAQRWIRVSALQQIAFVLNNYLILVQSQWIRLLLCLMYLSLRQSGNDFTFQFGWLKECATSK